MVTMKQCFLLVYTILHAVLLNAQKPFVTVWKTDNAGESQNNQIILPVYNDSFLVEWHDVKNPSVKTKQKFIKKDAKLCILTLPKPGMYAVGISPLDNKRVLYGSSSPMIVWATAKTATDYGESLDNEHLLNQRTTYFGDQRKLIDVKQWGEFNFTCETADNLYEYFSDGFNGCSNMDITAIDLPIFGGTRYKCLSRLFKDCFNLKGNESFNNWNLAGLEYADEMFYNAYQFNQPIDKWNMQSVRKCFRMFKNAVSFNQPVGIWNTNAFFDCTSMFEGATSFNKNINSWKVSNVVFMWRMFKNATSFNQPLDGWRPLNVLFLGNMFDSAVSFNQQFTNGNLKSALFLTNMFKNAKSYNQEQITQWSLNNFAIATGILDGATAYSYPKPAIALKPATTSDLTKVNNSPNPDNNIEKSNRTNNCKAEHDKQVAVVKQKSKLFSDAVKNEYDKQIKNQDLTGKANDLITELFALKMILNFDCASSANKTHNLAMAEKDIKSLKQFIQEYNYQNRKPTILDAIVLGFQVAVYNYY
jgi:hypothetical protein